MKIQIRVTQADLIYRTTIVCAKTNIHYILTLVDGRKNILGIRIEKAEQIRVTSVGARMRT